MFLEVQDAPVSLVRPKAASGVGVLLRFVIHGKPAVQKNRKVISPMSKPCPACHMAPKRTLTDNKQHKAWWKAALPQLEDQWGKRPPISRKARIKAMLVVYVGARQHPDIDGAASGPMDALEKAGILENDYCIEELYAIRRKDDDNPRIEITLWVPTEHWSD